MKEKEREGEGKKKEGEREREECREMGREGGEGRVRGGERRGN